MLHRYPEQVSQVGCLQAPELVWLRVLLPMLILVLLLVLVLVRVRVRRVRRVQERVRARARARQQWPPQHS